MFWDRKSPPLPVENDTVAQALIAVSDSLQVLAQSLRDDLQKEHVENQKE